jgi:hypothetical protein
VSGTVTPLRPAANVGWRAEWPAAVTAAVRPEFRVGVLYPERSNPVLFGRPCSVAGCPGPGRGRHLLCVAHGTQFRKRGSGLTVDAWLSLPGERGGPRVPRSMRELAGCRVGGCGRSAWTRVLCHSHHLRWRRTAGRPDLALYCATTPPEFEGSEIRPPASCAVEGCRFPRMARTVLCDGHQRRFADRRRRKGYTVERFLAEWAHPGQPGYVFEGLPEPLRSELQFGLQCFSDRRSSRMRPAVFADAVGRLRECGYRSLFDGSPTSSTTSARRPGGCSNACASASTGSPMPTAAARSGSATSGASSGSPSTLTTCAAAPGSRFCSATSLGCAP